MEYRAIKSVLLALLLGMQCAGWQTGGACGGSEQSSKSNELPPDDPRGTTAPPCRNCVCPSLSITSIVRATLTSVNPEATFTSQGIAAGASTTSFGVSTMFTVDPATANDAQLEQVQFAETDIGAKVLIYILDDNLLGERVLGIVRVNANNTISCNATGQVVSVDDALAAAMSATCATDLASVNFSQPTSSCL